MRKRYFISKKGLKTGFFGKKVEIFRRENEKLRGGTSPEMNKRESEEFQLELGSEREDKKRPLFKSIYLFLLSKKAPSHSQFISPPRTPYFQVKSRTSICLYQDDPPKNAQNRSETYNFKEIFLNSKVF